MVEVVDVVEVVELVEVVEVVEVVEWSKWSKLTEKSMKLETSPKLTKSKRSLHRCRSISKKIPAHFLIQYQSKSYYIIGQEVYYSIGLFLLKYRALITLSGVFITLSGSNYSIGRLLHYRLVQCVSEKL